MSFNSRKVLAGQQIAAIGDLELDRCVHTTAQSVLDGAVNALDGAAPGFLGFIALSGGNPLSFVNSIPYLKWDDEFLKVDIISNTQLKIEARGQFGTVDAFHSTGPAEIQHSGQADGSCYATPSTCSSPDSYDPDTKILFRFPSTQLDLDEHFYNGFSSWKHSAGTVDPGQSMGTRSGATLTLKDSVDNDLYVPYPERRTSNGTLFSKLIARSPNFEGRPKKIHTGFNPLDLDFDNFLTREYVIDSADLKKGVFTVKGVDPLIMTDDKKAKAPFASLGTSTAAITDVSTEITYTNAPAFDYGPATTTVFVRLDSEVIECTVLSDFVLTIVTRAVGGTEQKDHEENATVQECLIYDGVNVVVIIEDLLTNYTKVPAVFLDDYSAVIAATSSITLTANINKPTSVKTLIDELIKTGDLVVFYDEESQLIKIKQVSDASVEPISINENDHIGQESIDFKRDTKNQFTRYSVAWAPNDITKTSDEENFSIVYQAINVTNELPQNIGEVNEKKIFFNRWLTTSSADVIKGTSIAQRVIDRSQAVPKIADFELDVESVFDTQGGRLELGSIITLLSSREVEVDGSPKAQNHQILSLSDLGDMRYKVKSRLFQDPIENITVDFTITENKEDYDLSTEFAPAAGNYVVLIDTGVTIGGTVTGGNAFTTGSQAAGVTIDFIFRGAVEGKGGRGGIGGILIMPVPQDIPGNFSVDGGNGLDGGNAFNATIDCTINVGSGAIWAGGGGSGGRMSSGNNVTPISAFAGNGGSGGQGFIGGSGGDGGTVRIESSPILDTGVDGSDGSRGAPGNTGGSLGGVWGEQGDSPSGSDGGLSGFAIISNGNTVTISSGDNALNIRGRRS